MNEDRIAELEARIADLPPGYISKKTINGRIRYYHQWYEAGKTRSSYVREADLVELEGKLADRRRCELELKRLKEINSGSVSRQGYRTDVVTGDALLRMAEGARGLERRDCYGMLDRYLRGDSRKVCVLYGLRRTGKSIMIWQAILDMTPGELEDAAYLLMTADNTIPDLRQDIALLMDRGFRTFFIDEATLIRYFADGCGFLAKVVTASGCKVVLSGTDSLGLWFAEDDALYCDALMIHTSRIPYREHSRIIGTSDIDDYIELGGTLRKGEALLEDPGLFVDDIPLGDARAASRYSDLAIAWNIQNSLANTRRGMSFRTLADLYRANELTNAINRVVEDINHEFTVEVITRGFESGDLVDASDNLSQDGNRVLADSILDGIDREAVNGRLKRALGIRDAEECTVEVTRGHVSMIRSYLQALDLLDEIDVMTLTDTREDSVRQLFLQPGMRFCQAKALVESLNSDPTFGSLDEARRRRVIGRLLDTVRGRILEEIVLHETKDASMGRYSVYDVRFDRGEVDILVYDSEGGFCIICEIKHSTSRTPHQRRHLVDPEKRRLIERFVAPIAGSIVLYRGEDAEEDGVRYMNVESYLKGLPDSVGVLFPGGLDPGKGATDNCRPDAFGGRRFRGSVRISPVICPYYKD